MRENLTMPMDKKKYVKREKCFYYYNELVNTGILNREPCMICKSTNRIAGHHEDYNKPKEVLWLCNSHHHKLHNLRRKYSLEESINILKEAIANA